MEAPTGGARRVGAFDTNPFPLILNTPNPLIINKAPIYKLYGVMIIRGWVCLVLGGRDEKVSSRPVLRFLGLWALAAPPGRGEQ